MSLFYSPFYDRVIEFNCNETWRKFLGKRDPDLHMNDVEAVVRAFAMREMNNEYKSPMRVFLNRFSEKAKHYETEKNNKITDCFFAIVSLPLWKYF